LGISRLEAVEWGKYLQCIGVIDQVESKFEFGDNQNCYHFSSKRDIYLNPFRGKEIFIFNDRVIGHLRRIIIVHLAQIKKWVIDEIEYAQTCKGHLFTLKVIQSFISVGKELLELNNLHSLQAILAGLDIISRITKYKATWEKITQEELSWFISTRAIYNSFSVLYKSILHLKLPCVPCVLVYLDKIYQIVKHCGQPNLSEVLVNVKRIINVGKIIELFVRVQNMPPIFEHVPVIQEYINNVIICRK